MWGWLWQVEVEMGDEVREVITNCVPWSFADQTEAFPLSFEGI